MTILFKYILGISFLSPFATACSTKKANCLRAKVIRVSCASFVVQVLNRDSIGEYGWRDVSGHTVYNNVFNVKNSCSIGKWGRGEEFYFSIKDSASASDCITCMMYDAPPGKSYQLENISLTCQ